MHNSILSLFYNTNIDILFGGGGGLLVPCQHSALIHDRKVKRLMHLHPEWSSKKSMPLRYLLSSPCGPNHLKMQAVTSCMQCTW